MCLALCGTEGTDQKDSRSGCSPEAEGLEMSFSDLFSGPQMSEMVAVPELLVANDGNQP